MTANLSCRLSFGRALALEVDMRDYRIEHQDAVDNAAFDLLCMVSGCERECLQWDIELITEVVEQAERSLEKRGLPLLGRRV